jgi:AraC-like DNA-binding protein/ligand-binding sensor protein
LFSWQEEHFVSEHKTVLSETLRQDFQKDLELFKYFLLLLNHSSPIRNVELMWAEEFVPQKSVFAERLDTQAVLVQLQPEHPALSNRNSPSTHFCDLVHGFGLHEKETCAKSDAPAKQRCRATQCTQVYPCHIGLTDIAVPVISEGEYLGTLFSGQVLLHPPTPEHFEQIKQTLAGAQHIDPAQLELAYYEVPVVSHEELSEMTRALELFARYIANSWKRLHIMGDLQRVHSRELVLDRKELAAMLLSGHIEDVEHLHELTKLVGLRRLPDCLMVLRLLHEPAGSPAVSQQIALSRLSQVIEDFCQTWPNTLSVSGTTGEVYIFTTGECRNPSHHRISMHERCEAVLAALRRQGFAGARIGVASHAAEPKEFLRLYQEACSALNSQRGLICFFEENRPEAARPAQSLALVTKAIRQGENVDAAVLRFLANGIPSGNSPEHLSQTRAVLTWAVEHLALEVVSLGLEPRVLAARKENTVREIVGNASPFACCEAVRGFAGFLAEQVSNSFAHREKKILLAVTRLVERRGTAGVTIQHLADALHLSPGHLSRVYSRATGTTLEEYLIRQRIQMAKRLLLDPRLNVAQVSDRCGFCNPAYFASVFKKYVQCTPRQFACNPSDWNPPEPSRDGADEAALHPVGAHAESMLQEITIP